MTGDVAGTRLTVVMPTRDRRERALRTLARLGEELAGHRAEAIVVDDGSSDGSAAAIADLAASFPVPLRVERLETSRGPGAARNRGLGLAAGSICLFLGDDIVPRPGLVARHLDFHRSRPDPGDALLGRVVPAPPLDRSPFLCWLHEHGKQYAYGLLESGAQVQSRFFYAANSSLKLRLLRTAGGFDERFRFGHEEAELAGRLQAAGLRLHYDAEVVAEHDHPTDLAATLRRMREFGRSQRLLTELDRSQPGPGRPTSRHRLAAIVLALPALVGLRPAPVRARTWRFLCEQASREAFWGERDPADPAIRVGRTLARLAARDPATRLTPTMGRS